MLNDMLLKIEASKYPYWRVDLAKPEKTVVSKNGTTQVNGILVDFAKLLSQTIKNKMQQDPTLGRAFDVEVLNLRFRIQIMGVNGKLAAARLIQSTNPKLEDLGLNKKLLELLASHELGTGGGFVIFSGEIGSGKTTTAMATICRQLEKFGGFCLSIEDPIEFPTMSGFHGDKGGFMEQISAHNLDYATPLIESLRCFPPGERGILYIGEIRDNETAAEALRFSIAGYLVITTIHANDAVSALQRLLSLASAAGEEQARSLLSSSLKLVVNQKLTNGVLNTNVLLAGIDPKNTVCPRIQSGGDLVQLREQMQHNNVKYHP